MNIPEHRKAIDKLDAQIVKLLNERTKHVLAIGEIKLKAGEEIYAPHRERAVLQRVCRLNQGPMTNESLRAIYREIMSSALSLEKSLTIAYLGPEATFTHQAAIRRFGSSLLYASQKTIADVFAEVSKNRADYGVVPVENSTEGVVTHTLDMFVDSDLKIVAQIILPMQQCLLSNGRRTQITKLYRASAIAGAMPRLGADQPAARRDHRDLLQCPLRRAGREGKERGRYRRRARRREIRRAACSSRTSRTTPPTPRASSCWAGNAARPPATTARA